jgi:hypothetical protein
MSSVQFVVRPEDELLESLDWLVIRCSFENRAEAGYWRSPESIESVGHPDFTAWNRLDDEDWSDLAT